MAASRTGENQRAFEKAFLEYKEVKTLPAATTMSTYTDPSSSSTSSATPSKTALVEKQTALIRDVEALIQLIKIKNHPSAKSEVRNLWEDFIEEITHPDHGFGHERIYAAMEKFQGVLRGIVEAGTQQIHISLLHDYLSKFDTEAKSFDQVMRNFHFNVRCVQRNESYWMRQEFIKRFEEIVKSYKGGGSNEAALVAAIKDFRNYVMNPTLFQIVCAWVESCLKRIEGIISLPQPTPMVALLPSSTPTTTTAAASTVTSTVSSTTSATAASVSSTTASSTSTVHAVLASSESKRGGGAASTPDWTEGQLLMVKNKHKEFMENILKCYGGKKTDRGKALDNLMKKFDLLINNSRLSIQMVGKTIKDFDHILVQYKNYEEFFPRLNSYVSKSEQYLAASPKVSVATTTTATTSTASSGAANVSHQQFYTPVQPGFLVLPGSEAQWSSAPSKKGSS